MGAVQGKTSVCAAISTHNIRRTDYVTSVGKAAASMAATAHACFGAIPAIVVTDMAIP